jgi:chaperonin GroES
MKFRPLNSFIQVDPIVPASKHGAIYLAAQAVVPPTRGKVIAMGPGKATADGLAAMPAIKEGDVIAFTSGSLQAVKAESGNVYIVEAEALLGVEAE